MKRAFWVLGIAFIVAGAVVAFSFAFTTARAQIATTPLATTSSSGGSSGLCITAPVASQTSSVGTDPFYTQVDDACWQEFGSTYEQCVANGTAGTTGCSYGNQQQQALAFNCGMPESAGETQGYCQAGGSSNCITPMTNAQKDAALGNVVCTASGQAGNLLNGSVYGPQGPSGTAVVSSCVSSSAPPTPPSSSDTSSADLSQYVTLACSYYYGPTATQCADNPLWLTGGVCTHYTEPQLAYNCGEPLMGADASLGLQATYPAMTPAQMATDLEPLVLSVYVSNACGQLFQPQVQACTLNEAAGSCTYSDPALAYNCSEPLMGSATYPTMTQAQIAAALEADSCSGVTSSTGSTNSSGTTTSTTGSSQGAPSSQTSFNASLNAFLSSLTNVFSILFPSSNPSTNSSGNTCSPSLLGSDLSALAQALQGASQLLATASSTDAPSVTTVVQNTMNVVTQGLANISSCVQ